MKPGKLVIAMLILFLCIGMPLSGCTQNPSPAPSGDDTDINTPTSTTTITPVVDYAVDFSDGKTGFLFLNTGNPDTDPESSMEVVDLDGVKALKLTAPNGGALRVGVNVNGLLGNRAPDVCMSVFDVFAEFPDGNFYAVAGSITAYSSALSEPTVDSWTVYLATRNPNPATAELEEGEEFAFGGPNIFEFSCTTNGAFDNGDTPAVIYIKSIMFYDKTNTAIPVDTDAGWEGPEGYGDAPEQIIATPDPTMFVDEGAGKLRFPFAHLIGPYATVTILYTPAENSGNLEFILKDPDNGYWAQCAVDEITEEGSQRRAVITAASIEKKFPGSVQRAGSTSERGIVLTNWVEGTTIDEIIIEGATAMPIDIDGFDDEGGGKYRYHFADRIAPYSTVQILYTPAVFEGGDNLEFIVMDPENGYWLQRAADEIADFGNGKQYLATIKAEGFEKDSSGAFARAGGTDDKGIVITNWSPDTVINEILIYNPLPSKTSD